MRGEVDIRVEMDDLNAWGARESVRSPEAESVWSLLNVIAASGLSPALLHSPSPDSVLWLGDVDFVVRGSPEALFQAVDQWSAGRGYMPVLKAQRVFNTLEVDLLFPRSSSWTIVLVDHAGTVINLDVVFTSTKVPAAPLARDVSSVAEVTPEIGVAYLALKRIRKRDSRPTSWSFVDSSPRPISDVLEPYIGSDLARGIDQAVAVGEPIEPDTLARSSEALVRRRRSMSATDAMRLARAALTAAGRIATPAGAFVVLAGVDGSGKSTAAANLAAWAPFRRVRRLHARPGLLKPPGWFVGRTSGDGRDPHDLSTWQQPVSLLRLVYLWFDFAVGYWVRVWPITSRGGFVVSERWWWDMYVDPRRHRMQSMPRLVKVLGRFVRAPEATFVFDAEPATILQRKQELSFVEIERQRAAWTELVSSIRSLQFVDASLPSNEVADQIVSSIAQRQAERWAGR
jgi:thymidylate kinase